MKQSVKHIRGINMYLDERDRDIYYDVFTKQGFVINPKDAKKFDIYRNRFMLVFMSGVLAVNFIFKLQLTIIICLVILAGLEYSFRFKFLPQCIALPNFKKGKKAVIDNHDNKNKEVLRIVLYLLFAGLIVANAYVAEYDMVLVVASYIAAIIAIVAAIKSITYLRK